MSISSRLIRPGEGEEVLDLDEPTIEIFEGVLTPPVEKPAEKPVEKAAAPKPEPAPQPPAPPAAKPAPPKPQPQQEAVPVEIPHERSDKTRRIGSKGTRTNDSGAHQLVLEEWTGPAGEEGGDGVSNDADLASVREVFADLARVHVSHVRDVMMELRYGDVACSWVAEQKVPMQSLKKMAKQMDLTDLCAAIDEFCIAVDQSIAGQAKVSDENKARLIAHYDQLQSLIPAAFALDGERDKREPIIVRALLLQVEGVEKLTIDRLFAAGLHRLEALLKASGDEIAVVAGVRLEVAQAIADRFRGHRAAVGAALSSPDTKAAKKEIYELVAALREQHVLFEKISTEWSDDSKARRLEARSQRDNLYLQIKVALARFGESDRVDLLEPLPFARRLELLEQLVDQLAKS
jgi:hypothetical protein